MTRFIYDTATSFTGWIADSDHSLQWLFDVPGGTEPDPELLPPTDALIVEGSSTYEWILRESDLVDHPEKWHELFGTRRTFVFTSRNLPVPEGADVTSVSGPVTGVLSEIRDAAGESDVWIVGGGELAAQFYDAGALDEIAISIAPVALTSGAPLFPRRVESDRLRLVEARQVGQFARLRFVVDAPRVGPAGD